MTTGRKPRSEFPARDGWQRASGGLVLTQLLERDFELVEISARRVVSLDHIGIVIDLEDEFNLEIPDEDVDAWKTVAVVIAYVDGKVVGK